MPRTRLASVIAPFALLAATLASSVAVAAPSFRLVGMAPGTGASRVYGLSADGRSAAGYSQEPTSVNTRYPGFLWNADTGRNDFGVGMSQSLTLGYGISGNGLVVVGESKMVESGAGTAFRWTQNGGYSTLGSLPGYSQSVASDANIDGSIIVGVVRNGTGSIPQAFRWTQAGGMQGLGVGTTATDISLDGSTIVGNSGTAPNGFRWTQSGGIQFLPSLGGVSNATASGVNYDGSIVVGNSGANHYPTMWLNNTPMDLMQGSDGSIFMFPGSVNDLGTVVAGTGQSSVNGQQRAGVWTPDTGIMWLSDYLAANGVTIPAGITLTTCTAISSDGTTFAGWTSSSQGIQGFVATILPPCPSDLDNDGSFPNGPTRDHAVTIDDLLYFLTGFEAGSTLIDLDNGSNTGTPDNAVTINDLLYFLTHFEAGC